MNKQRKEYDCPICGVKFVKMRIGQKTCFNGKCALAFARQEKKKKEEKAERRLLREKRRELRPRAEYLKDAQRAVNAYVRERDKNKPCVSCGTTEAKWDAGHYRTTAAAPQLRFDPRQIHKQCSVCNQHKSGNIVSYRAELIRRIGVEAVEEIENSNEIKRWSIEELKAVREQFKFQLTQLKKGTI
ncbi:MAG: recombination protein NinG [Enterobacteriaceae bacterium]|jgi:hypothetical protein|nr:recombination protein NinG [Enterobacteriaceae bacterium]